MKKLVKKLNGAYRQIHLGMDVNFQSMELVDDCVEGTLSYEYAGTTNTMTLKITKELITLLTIHVIEKEFPFINAVVGFEEFTKGRDDGAASYYKDEQNYIFSNGFRLFTAGLQFSYEGTLTEVGLLERIRKSILFSYEFSTYLDKLVHKRPKKIKDEQVQESVRYLIIRDALLSTNSIKDQEPIEKDETWELMNTFTISGAAKGKEEVPAILSFGRKNDEMAAEVLIDAKKSRDIEIYQQGAIQLALQCKAEKIDFSDEYIKDEKGTYFKYKIIARHHYNSEEIAAFIKNMAKVAANLILKI